MLKGFKNSPELDFSIPENEEAMLKAFEQVDKEKGQDYPLIIGGERIMTDKKIVSIAPSTKEVLGQVSSCDQELADKAIQTAHKAFQSYFKIYPIYYEYNSKFKYNNDLNSVPK